MSDVKPNPTSYPLVDRDKLMRALANPIRWKVLQLIAGGEGIGQSDLGQLYGMSGSAAKKHLEMLVEAGICVRGRGRLYRFAPRFQPPTGGPFVIDFGHCLIRLNLDTPGS